jgi:hypothetical protein
MTSISQRDRAELMQAFDQQIRAVSTSKDEARKFLAKWGFGNYCDAAKNRSEESKRSNPCTCRFCESETRRQYDEAEKNSRFARLFGFNE